MNSVKEENQEEKAEIVELYLDDIIPNRFQPREVFDEKALKELAVSIKEHGVIQPIIVRSIDGKYEIIAGERRYKASALAGLTKIPAIIRNLNDKEASKVALLENLQRKNLNPIEEARTYQKILELDEMTQEDLAKTMGKSQSSVANKLRLLQLSDSVQEALLKEQISEKHARTLLKLDDPKEQQDMLKKVIDNKMSVRLLEEEIGKMQPNKEGNEEGKVFVPEEPEEKAGIGNFINTAPLEPTTEIKEPEDDYGKIKIISPEGTPTDETIPNYADVDKEEENPPEEEKSEESQPVVDIAKEKEETQDISTGFDDKSNSSLDSLLNIQTPTPLKEESEDEESKPFITAGEAIVKNEEEDTSPEKSTEDYFKNTDLININLPSSVTTISNSDTSVSDTINELNNTENANITGVEGKQQIKELIEKLKSQGLNISLDEMDFEKNYQLIIKIEKQ